jgi:predicted MPP superfamily phosphohydrolase
MIDVIHRIGRAAARVAGLGAGGTELHGEQLELPNWPLSLTGVRIAVLADLHTGSPQVDERRLRDIVALVNRQQVDVVALLGDYIDPDVAFGEWISPETIAARLGDLRSRFGRFAVLGNHDWGHAGPRMPVALRREEIDVLENSAVRSEAGFWIAGVGDHQTRGADVAGTLARIPAGEPIILLSHNPDVFPDVPERVALTLSGHTHGSQVNLPVLRDMLTPSRFGARYTDGHIVEGGRHLFVSNGIGTSRLPVRIGSTPEVVVLELSPSSSASPS